VTDDPVTDGPVTDDPAAPSAHEAVTAPSVAEEEAERDDAGRAAGHAGWGVQARMFGGIASFIAFIGAIYWFVSYENAGTTLLALTAVMAAMTAAYVGWPRRDHHPHVDDDGGQQAEPGHDPHDGVWFPEASIWPVAIGAGMVLVGNGLLLGRWLLIPAAVFLTWALAGMIRQGRHRI